MKKKYESPRAVADLFYPEESINLNRVPRPYFNMGVGECVLTDTLSFPLIPNILFYCVQTVFTNR